MKINNSGSSLIQLSTSNLPSHSHSIPSLSEAAASTGNGYSIGYTYVARTSTYGNSATFRIVSTSGISAAVNHITGFSSSSYVDITGTSYPLRNHTHDYNDYYANSISGIEVHTHSITTNASNTEGIGNGQSFSVQNPYITVYMYKRIS